MHQWLNYISHLILRHGGATLMPLQAEREHRFWQSVKVPSSYLASRAWAKTWRELATDEASLPEKTHVHIICELWGLKHRLTLNKQINVMMSTLSLPKTEILCLTSAASLQKRLHVNRKHKESNERRWIENRRTQNKKTEYIEAFFWKNSNISLNK